MIGFILAVAVAAAPSFQGPTPATIDSGMTRAQVVAKLGEPMSTRIYEGHTYLLYKNGCERTCGMSDLVVLDSDKVVDAIFRSSARRYSGTSSSPRMISLADARRGTDNADADKAVKVVKPAKVATVIAVDAAKPSAKAPAPAKIAAVEVPKTAAKAQPAKVVKADAPKTVPVVSAPVRVEQVKAEPAKVEVAPKVVKVDNGETAQPKPAAAPAGEKPAPKLPEVFRPAPTPKKDTTKIKKPTS